ncbi:hypothetical protein [Methylobacterium nodulans]|uniref:Uncharacterized protein n=1 Tax=Methylobacterium nodulans (strain LMG 21967 / CNCM I-2342 / ORS 2060) TaxID=460265 RepID=B8IXY9_METNO|nr:hypothetical protein [Methylobacterium nodulans]ACL63279.1 hypothetical protein Mnod_7685 [Methylobacterium nodulans ORS 2060]
MRALQGALAKYGIAIHLSPPEDTPSPHSLRYILDSWASGLDFNDEDDGADLEEDEPHPEVRSRLDRLIAGIVGEPVPDGYYDDETEAA